jgi:type I restriction enzyme R subunit
MVCRQEEQPKGDQRAGVFGITAQRQELDGLYGKLVLVEEMNNPTIVVLTDRNDLDQQLETFTNCQISTPDAHPGRQSAI